MQQREELLDDEDVVHETQQFHRIIQKIYGRRKYSSTTKMEKGDLKRMISYHDRMVKEIKLFSSFKNTFNLSRLEIFADIEHTHDKV